MPLRIKGATPLNSMFVSWANSNGDEIEVIIPIGDGKCGAVTGTDWDSDVVFEDDVGFVDVSSGKYSDSEVHKFEFTNENSCYGISIVEDEDNPDITTRVAKRWRCERMSSDQQCQQLWAEVYHYYMLGEQWWPSIDLEDDLKIVHGEHKQTTQVSETLSDKFNIKYNDKWMEKNNDYLVKGSNGLHFIERTGRHIRFISMNMKALFDEVESTSFTKRTDRVLIKSFLSSNGFIMKKRKLSAGSTKTAVCVRMVLKEGERLTNPGLFIVSSNGKDGKEGGDDKEES